MPRSSAEIALCIVLCLSLSEKAFAGSFVDYYKIGTGYAYIQDVSADAKDASGPLEFSYSSENGQAIMLGVGLNINEWSFIELQLQQNDRVDLSGILIDEGAYRDKTDVSLETDSLMASYQVNITKLLKHDNLLSLYIGLGAGAANNKIGTLTLQSSSANIPESSNIDFSYRLTAGILLPISGIFTADISYSYSNYGSTEKQNFGFDENGEMAPFDQPFEADVLIHEVFFCIIF